jgi:hypothetical protein
MDKIAFMVIKPFTIKKSDKAKAFGEGEVLHLSQAQAERFVEGGYLALQAEEVEQIKVTGTDESPDNVPSTFGDLLAQHKKRTQALVQHAGLNSQAASAYAAESTLSTLRRLRTLETPVTPSLIDGSSLPKNKNRFNKEATENGVGEWAQYSYNIARGCLNGCVYCYAKTMAVRFGRVDMDVDWSTSTTLEEKIAIHQTADGIVMFPSTHDITTDNLDACIATLRNILQAGNRVLVVSKPSWPCIEDICKHFSAYRDQLTFRFTIGSTDEEITKILEPNAPLPQERIACLQYAYELGFNTSVSTEPLLGGIQTALSVYMAVEPYVTDKIWIGKVQRPPAQGYPQEVLDTLSWVKEEQVDTRIKLMYEMMKDFDKVSWKDSIQKVISR